MIHTLTLNPAIDRILYLEEIKKNSTNRVKSKIDTIGGKGTHVSINLGKMGILNQAFGFGYGKSGKWIIDKLKNDNVIPKFVYSPKLENRTNYVLVEKVGKDKVYSTTIAEKGIDITNDELDSLINLIRNNVGDNDTLIFSGDASNSSDSFIYNKISNELKPKNLRICIDASGVYLKNALELNPFLIKPNQDELEELCGFKITSENDVIKAIASLHKYKIDVIAVSLGKIGGIVYYNGNYYKTIPPEVNVVNTAGCGDSFLAALLYGFEKKLDIESILRYATAVSSAKAAFELSVGFDMDYANKLIASSVIKKIKL